MTRLQGSAEEREEQVCPLFSDAHEIVRAKDIRQIRIARMETDKAGRKVRKFLPLSEESWQPNPYETDEAELGRHLVPGEYYVDAIGHNGRTLPGGHPVHIADPRDVLMDGDEGDDDDRRDRDRDRDPDDRRYGDGGPPEGSRDRGGAPELFDGHGPRPEPIPAGPPVIAVTGPDGKSTFTVAGLPPEKQAEMILAQRQLDELKAMAERREKEAKDALTDLRRREDELRERAQKEALAAAGPQSPASQMRDILSALVPILQPTRPPADETQTKREQLLDDSVRLWRDQFNRKQDELDEMRRSHRQELDRMDSSWRDKLDRAEKSFSDKISRAEKDIDELRRKNHDLARERYEAQMEADRASRDTDERDEEPPTPAAPPPEGFAAFMQQIQPFMPMILEWAKSKGMLPNSMPTGMPGMPGGMPMMPPEGLPR